MQKSKLIRVTDFCNSFAQGEIDICLQYLAEDVVYQNMPWPPITGHQAVAKALKPFISGEKCTLEKMHIINSLEGDNLLMNERLETWRSGDTLVQLPVTGVFEFSGEKIKQWRDYFDAATLQPILSAMRKSP